MKELQSCRIFFLLAMFLASPFMWHPMNCARPSTSIVSGHSISCSIESSCQRSRMDYDYYRLHSGLNETGRLFPTVSRGRLHQAAYASGR